MANEIHPSAIIGDDVKIGDGNSIGPFCHFAGNITIGNNCTFTGNVSIYGKTTIGDNNTFEPHSHYGGLPADLKFKGEDSELIIGNNNHFWEHVSIHRGTEGGGMITKVGDHNNMLMYTHIGHDAAMHSHCLMGWNTAIGGHSTLEDYGVISGGSATVPFIRIGRHAYVGAMSKISGDVPPFTFANGNPIYAYSINSEGLLRRDTDPEDVRWLKKGYKAMFMAGRGFNTRTSRLKEVVEESNQNPYLVEFLDFFQSSGRRSINAVKNA